MASNASIAILHPQFVFPEVVKAADSGPDAGDETLQRVCQTCVAAEFRVGDRQLRMNRGSSGVPSDVLAPSVPWEARSDG